MLRRLWVRVLRLLIGKTPVITNMSIECVPICDQHGDLIGAMVYLVRTDIPEAPRVAAYPFHFVNPGAAPGSPKTTLN